MDIYIFVLSKIISIRIKFVFEFFVNFYCKKKEKNNDLDYFKQLSQWLKEHILI